ncbi:MAG: GspE/PulE family protein [Pseudomonadota bacterium]
MNPQQLLTDDIGVPVEEVQKAALYQSRNGGRLEQILVNMGTLSTEQLPRYYSRLYELKLLPEPLPEQLEIDSLSATLKHDLLSNDLLPLRFDSEAEYIELITVNPSSSKVNDCLSQLPFRFDVFVASEGQYEQLQKLLNNDSEESDVVDLSLVEEDRLKELATEAPTVNLLNNLIARGLRRRASDMHIEPYHGSGRVRYRIDGVLQEADTIANRLLLPVVTRLKLLSKMDIAEKRRPQDGKIELRIDGRDVDIRVSALPVADGESIVMRFLLQDSLSYDVAKLGIEQDIERELLRDIQSTSGVVLLTGPTGSGKTTSLYSFLQRRNEPGVKIITIEDPVEYQLEGVNQVHVQPEIGYNFASALRSVVRQDPDVIMVGEIRDSETASIALQSALTGHLVFSTLHTNDAASAYTRLLDLGVEEFLLSAAVKSIVAQRLVRKLCPHCSVEDKHAEQQVQSMKVDWLFEQLPEGELPAFKKAVGCDKCANTGYQGRIAVIEYLRCDDELRELIGHSDFLRAVKKLNRGRGYRTLFEDGLLKVIRGVTTLDEVTRVTG